MKGRLKAFIQRRQPFRRLRRVVGFNRTAAVIRTGGGAALSFATGNMGVASSTLHRQRTAVAATLNCKGAGDLDMTLVLADATAKGRADPAFAAHMEPIVQWATAVWYQWLPALDFHDLHEHAQYACRDDHRMWSRVAGPAAAAAASARRLGWSMPGPDRFTTDAGRELRLKTDAPADVEAEVIRAVRRWRWRRVHRRLPALAGDQDGASTGALAPGPFVDPLLYLLTAKARNKDWTAKHQGALRAAIVGRHWTQAQKHRAFGKEQVPSPNCRLCVAKGFCSDWTSDPAYVGTPWHRLWTCPALAGFRERHMPDEVVEHLNQISRAGPPSQAERLFMTRGLRISPSAWLPTAPAEPTFQWIKTPPKPHRAGDLVAATAHFTDGSMIDAHWQTAGLCARRGWAFALKDQHGRTLALARGRPPQWAPGIYGAELWALLQCASTSVESAPFFVDCMAVHLGAQRDGSWARHHARKLARLWAPLHAAMDSPARRVHWMPAHCGFDEAGTRQISDGTPLTTSQIVANREVDKHAKAAAEIDRLPKELVARVRKEWMLVVAVARWIGVVTVRAQRHDVEEDPSGRGKKRIRDSEGMAAEALPRGPGAPVALQDDGRPGHEAELAAARARGQRRAVRRRHQEGEAVMDERRVAQWLLQRAPGRPAKRPASELLDELARRVRARVTQPDP